MYNNGKFSGVIKDEYGTMTMSCNNIILEGSVDIHDNHSTTQRILSII